jgi:small-conductance mechanosensitive channel
MKKFIKAALNPQSRITLAVILITIILIAALAILGYITPVIKYLDSDAISFTIFETKVTAYKLIKRAALVLVLFWIANYISYLGQNYVRRIKHMRVANKTLLIKTFQIILYFIVFFLSLNILNINLSAFAFLGGAIGIGVGFGLQKIASNFISGLILLFERSIEEGDLVDLGNGTVGHLRHTGARYTLIEAADGKEIMVPNEDFITGRVTNYTYSNNFARIEILVGVAYNSDMEKVRSLMLEAALQNKSCIKDPAPTCYMNEFAASSVNFIMYFWVSNVLDGRSEPKSEVMFSIWRKFKEHNIEIPYQQVDVNLRK